MGNRLLNKLQSSYVLLNNDLSSGIPNFLDDVKQVILPSKNIGWTSRSKSEHFNYYSDVCRNFSKLLGIDSWLIEPEFRNCGEINFKTKQGEECLVYNAEKLFKLISEKYQKYNIDEKPYIIIKADSGTYGMGVISIDDINQIKINHYDLFRINSLDEIHNLGLFDDITNAITLIEWPQKIKPKPKNLIELNFEYGNDYKKRILKIKGLNL